MVVGKQRGKGRGEWYHISMTDTKENNVEVGGRYKHFKGGEYGVVGLAYDSDTLEEVVIYETLYESDEFPKGQWWTRPLDDFCATVDRNGKVQPRFTRIKAE